MKSGTAIGATFAQNAYYYHFYYQNELYFVKEKNHVSAYKAILYVAVNGSISRPTIKGFGKHIGHLSGRPIIHFFEFSSTFIIFFKAIGRNR